MPRGEPQRVIDERTMLEEWLEYHRATLRRKCSGLDDEKLRRSSCGPSKLSLLGLVCHLTDVERGWFLRGVAGKSAEEVPPLYYSDDDPDGDFDNVGTADAAAVFAAYDRTVAEVRAVTTGADLDRSFISGGAPCSVRWVFVHMIEEYARHNGHADLLRERIDGATGT